VVPTRDLRDRDDRPADPRNGDLRHLREHGLIETVRIPGYREQVVVLTDRGRDLLESNRDRDRDAGQNFYAGVKRERELELVRDAVARPGRESTGGDGNVGPLSGIAHAQHLQPRTRRCNATPWR
jgi:hypothetical protein